MDDTPLDGTRDFVARKYVAISADWWLLSGSVKIQVPAQQCVEPGSNAFTSLVRGGSSSLFDLG